MRHTEIQRAEAEYRSAFDLYERIKKVEEILISILLQILKAGSNLELAVEYKMKAAKVFDNPRNALMIAMLNTRTPFLDWFDDAGNSPLDKASFEEIKSRMEQEFAGATLQQIRIIKKLKNKLDFAKE